MAVGVEGAELREQPMLRSVVVGRARLEQAQLVAPLRQQLRLLRRVGDVEALDAVEPVLPEQVDRLEHLGVAVEVPVGMRPDGDAAGLVDPLDRLDHRRVRAREVGRLAGDQEVGQERGDVVIALGGESVRVGRMLQDRLREVRAADRLAGVAALREHRVVHLPAELLQLRAHSLRAQLAVRARVAQPLCEHRVVMVDPVAEDVQVLVAAEHRGDLGGGDDRHAVLGAGRDRLVDAVDGVVVREGEQLDAGSRCVRDDLRGRQGPVGVQRMGLKLVRGEAHGARGYRPPAPARAARRARRDRFRLAPSPDCGTICA